MKTVLIGLDLKTFTSKHFYGQGVETEGQVHLHLHATQW